MHLQRTMNDLAALPNQAVISAGEAASLLGKSVETLRRWRQKGLGPPYLRAVAREGVAEYLIGDVRDWQFRRTVAVGFRHGVRSRSSTTAAT
jgi:hypothetical protein